jgi:hypothetical protein
MRIREAPRQGMRAQIRAVPPLACDCLLAMTGHPMDKVWPLRAPTLSQTCRTSFLWDFSDRCLGAGTSSGTQTKRRGNSERTTVEAWFECICRNAKNQGDPMYKHVHTFLNLHFELASLMLCKLGGEGRVDSLGSTQGVWRRSCIWLDGMDPVLYSPRPPSH